jgi:hypothetical protein
MWMCSFRRFSPPDLLEERTTGERFSSGQAAGVDEFAPASDDRTHMAATRLLDRLRERSAGHAANGLLRPGHQDEAGTRCTKQILRQEYFRL